MCDTETRRLLLLCLYTVKCGDGDRGICAQVWKAHALLPKAVQIEHCHQMDTMMYNLFSSWPMFSGDIAYPIPSPYFKSARAAYYDTTITSDFWSGKYGRNRKDLLEYCIKRLRNGV